MPTIKTKKEMNLPELIEWANKNEVVCKEYRCNEDKGKAVTFALSGSIYFTDFKIYSIRDTFTVEIEEEITEDTVIHKLIELSDKGLLGRTILNINSSINLTKTDKSVAFYILNDDLTMTLIWRDGKLVE